MTRNAMPVVTAGIIGLGIAAKAILYCSLVAACSAIRALKSLRTS
jgi:hypothetical protein